MSPALQPLLARPCAVDDDLASSLHQRGLGAVVSPALNCLTAWEEARGTGVAREQVRGPWPALNPQSPLQLGH